MKPTIGINAELEGSLQNERLVLPTRYGATLERAGALPLVLTPLATEECLQELVSRLDGLLLSGADDFETESLGLGETHPAAKPVPEAKLDFDRRLTRAALEARVPVLGVCYGMQLMGILGGGGLYQHLPEDRPSGRDHRGGVVHEVEVSAGSKLAGLTGVARASVVSRHHQALCSVGSDWIVSAADDEGLIEAIEHRTHPFAVGVQWHPELSDEASDRRIFEGLVRKAREHAQERVPAPQPTTRPGREREQGKGVTG